MRIQVIDFARGIDIVLMVLFNWSVTLGFFRVVQMPTDFLYSFIFPRAIAAVFIFLSGVVAYASYKNAGKDFGKRYFVRGAKLALFASAITLVTWLFLPAGAIVFGILHFFALSSFIVPLLMGRGRLNLIAGIAIVLMGSYLQTVDFGSSYLFWLGLVPNGFFTFDYFPLLPWLGVLMLGIYFGKGVIDRASRVKIKGKAADAFSFLGKNSLTVYLLHQPLLMLVLFLLGFSLAAG